MEQAEMHALHLVVYLGRHGSVLHIQPHEGIDIAERAACLHNFLGVVVYASYGDILLHDRFGY